MHYQEAMLQSESKIAARITSYQGCKAFVVWGNNNIMPHFICRSKEIYRRPRNEEYRGLLDWFPIEWFNM